MKKSIWSLLFICICLFPFSLDAKKQKDIVLCTWNIGHFSNGSKHYSLIREDNYITQLEQYKLLLYTVLRPDIMVVNEYNRVFCGEDIESNKYVTSPLLFDGFRKSIVGPQMTGICNAVFSNLKTKKPRFVYFESHKRIDGDDELKSKENYCIESDIYIQGKVVKLVCLHLLFSNRISGVYQRSQIDELINRYKDTKRVILCGDWNTNTYTTLRDAGYVLANDGSLRTFPGKDYALDNIAVKGLEISNVQMIKTDLSDHYPLKCSISLK